MKQACNLSHCFVACIVKWWDGQEKYRQKVTGGECGLLGEWLVVNVEYWASDLWWMWLIGRVTDGECDLLGEWLMVIVTYWANDLWEMQSFKGMCLLLRSKLYCVRTAYFLIFYICKTNKMHKLQYNKTTQNTLHIRCQLLHVSAAMCHNQAVCLSTANFGWTSKYLLLVNCLMMAHCCTWHEASFVVL